MFQIVFNEISAAELSSLDTLEQLELLEEFKVSKEDLENLDSERFGKIERDGTVLYRFRAKDYRFYFEVKDGSVVVHRVLHRGTLSDFLFRSKMPLSEDEALAGSKHFWKLIDQLAPNSSDCFLHIVDACLDGGVFVNTIIHGFGDRFGI